MTDKTRGASRKQGWILVALCGGLQLFGIMAQDQGIARGGLIMGFVFGAGVVTGIWNIVADKPEDR